MQILTSRPHLTLSLHAGPCRALEARWTGAPGSALLRQATLECVELARAHGATGWVADDRLLGPVRPADLAWIVAFVLPLLVQGGVRRFARLEAADPRTQGLLGPVQESAAQHLLFELRSFTDPAPARAWACGQPNPFN